MSQAFPCRQCGATLEYSAGAHALECGFCGHRNEIVASREPVYEYDFLDAVNKLARAEPQLAETTVKCESCAAEFRFDPNVHADECMFCGTAIVEDTGQHKLIKPHALLPFRIEAQDARERFKSWLNGLWFAPGKVKRYARDDSRLTGIYVPYWTYDSDTTSAYQGMRGTTYQVPQQFVTIVNGKRQVRTRMVTKIRWTPVSGTVSRRFDDVLVLASKSLPHKITESLEPWDLSELQPYAEDYLRGFRSEVYQVELDSGFREAEGFMAPVIRTDAARHIGGDHQRVLDVRTRHADISFKHVLLPVWLAAFRFRDKSYRFVVNARTGQVQGERPYSAWKIAGAVIGVLIVLLVIVALSQGL